MPRVSVVLDRSLAYPAPGPASPATPYPEYPFGATELTPGNRVYAAVRRCLELHGCDAAHQNTPAWNPLGAWIKKGQRVFVLTNFVVHQRPWETLLRFRAKCTHASVIRPMLDYAAMATGDPALVSFGNAPLQSCDHAAVSRATGADEMAAFYRRVAGVEVGPVDLRLLRARWTDYGALLDVQIDAADQAVHVDLGADSWIEGLYRPGETVALRVGDYASGETQSYHGPGRHVYVMNRRILEADVIISVPKLKTHQKVGITCALKGTVGAVGRKECLAHHRKGGPRQVGDEYPRNSFLRDLSSDMGERAPSLGTDLRANLYRVASKVLNRALKFGPNGITYGAWHGNDTSWRMTLDLARILRYGRVDGTMSREPVRSHLALVDGIVAGEGEGPLTPVARPLGALLFGDDVCAVDVACAYAIGFAPERIPLLVHAFDQVPYPLTAARMNDVTLSLNGAAVTADALQASCTPPFATPKGWKSVSARLPVHA